MPVAAPPQPPPGPGYPYPPQQPPPGYPYQQPGPPYQQGPYYQPPGSPAPPRGGGSGKRIALILGGVLVIAAIVVALWMTGVIFAVGPKESVERAHQAFEKKDLATFDKYFDSEAVLRNLLDQFEALEPANDEQKQVRAHLPEVANVMKRALFGLPPPDETPEMHKLADRPGQQLKEAMSKTVFKGATSESRSGSDATVGTSWGDASGRSTETITLEFKLQKAGNHWKVVAIPNLSKVVK